MISKLESLGVEVFTPNKVANSQMDAKEDVWDQIAGYDQIKQVFGTSCFHNQDIKDTIILSIKYPEKYREIARKPARSGAPEIASFSATRLHCPVPSCLKALRERARRLLLV